jgi:hypothetical protein
VEGHATYRGMTPILGSKVRGLQATQEASVPCRVRPRGATYVGNATSRQPTPLRRARRRPGGVNHRGAPSLAQSLSWWGRHDSSPIWSNLPPPR